VIGEAVALHGDALLDNIAEMDADTEFDGSLGRQAGVAHDHAVLDLDCAPHLVDHTAKFDEEPVAGEFDHVPMMRGGRTLSSINPWKRRGRQRAQMPAPRRSEVRIPSAPPRSPGELPWVPGAHNPSTIQCVSAEAHGLRGLFCWDDGPWPATAK
jgi:hypothetical protein